MESIQQEIKVFDVVVGDFNDVFNRYYLKGTVEQIEQYIREEIESIYSKDVIEESYSDDIGFHVWQQMPTDLSDEDKEDWYPEVEYQISAQVLDDNEAKELLEVKDVDSYNNEFFYHKLYDLTQ